jgi:alanine dehydrogenase
MKIGLLKEIKAFEHRIMLVPGAVEQLINEGNTVYVESGAGEDSGYADKAYESAGAHILPTSEKVFNTVELVLKIQSPMPIELFRHKNTWKRILVEKESYSQKHRAAPGRG